jgi:hypothetical protein
VRAMSCEVSSVHVPLRRIAPHGLRSHTPC